MSDKVDPQHQNAYMRFKVLASRVYWRTHEYMTRLDEIHADLYSLEKGWKEDPLVTPNTVHEKLKKLSKDHEQTMQVIFDKMSKLVWENRESMKQMFVEDIFSEDDDYENAVDTDDEVFEDEDEEDTESANVSD